MAIIREDVPAAKWKADVITETRLTWLLTSDTLCQICSLKRKNLESWRLKDKSQRTDIAHWGTNPRLAPSDA